MTARSKGTKDISLEDNPYVIVDIETNGLLQDATKILCMVARNYKGTVITSRSPKEHRELALMLLQPEAGVIVGHNIIGFDLPMILKFTGVNLTTLPSDRLFDTLICSQLAFPDLHELTEDGTLPNLLKPADQKYWGRHSLKAWGQRLGVQKDFFGETEGAFSELTEDLVTYCQQDTLVTDKLYKYLLGLEVAYWNYSALELEQDVAKIISRQHRCGVHFDVRKAQEAYATLSEDVVRLQQKLRELFPDRTVVIKTFVSKVNNSKYGYKKGDVVNKQEIIEFNPSSNDHIAHWLSYKYGWKPSELTPTGKPKLDEESLKDASHLEGVPDILDYKLVSKLLTQLGSGEKAWLKHVDANGLIHGSVNSVGAATRRMTHSDPNLAQVPNASHKYGKLCRSLFGPPEHLPFMVGCDAEQLELRGLAHLLYPYDNGAYVKAAISGDKKLKTDIHWMNARSFGIDDRDMAKTMFYAMIYGSGDEKLGRIKTKSWDKENNRRIGRALKQTFYRKMPAFKQLLDAIVGIYGTRGYLIDANGHRFRLRSMHSALNAINQRLGAIVMKKAQQLLDSQLQEIHALKPMVDYEFLLTIHDEFQIGCRTLEIARDIVGPLAKQSIRNAGVVLNLKCPLDGAFSIGKTWADTH